MEELLPITNINDFLFCPRSLFFGNIYRKSLDKDCFLDIPQKQGLSSHKTLDTQTYSSKKSIISGMMVVCASLGLIGRIDLLDIEHQTLTERKTFLSTIWEGQRMQLFAQYWALVEMGYKIKCLRFHSIQDNRTYNIEIPTEKDFERIQTIISDMRSFRLDDYFLPNTRNVQNVSTLRYVIWRERRPKHDDFP